MYVCSKAITTAIGVRISCKVVSTVEHKEYDALQLKRVKNYHKYLLYKISGTNIVPNLKFCNK